MAIAEEKFGAIRRGMLEFLILKIVSSQEVYAADMIYRLEKTDFAVQEGTLYPLLSKLRREELLEYTWQESESGPPRKYYRLTAKGKTCLSDLNKYWKHLNSIVEKIGN